jgi:hypothetical protein
MIVNEFKLLAGEFEAADAKEILMSLLDDKIAFHAQKQISYEERYGKREEHADVRIAELKESKKEILELLAIAEKENRKLVLSSSIKLS